MCIHFLGLSVYVAFCLYETKDLRTVCIAVVKTAARVYLSEQCIKQEGIVSTAATLNDQNELSIYM
jgi:uncharacterized membrane protein